MMAGGERWILEVTSRLKERYGWKIFILTTTIGYNAENLSKVRKVCRQYDIEYLSTNPLLPISSRIYITPKLNVLKSYVKSCDVLYWLDGFPRPLSDIVLKSLILESRKPLIQGLHQPLFIPKARRTSHVLHNIFNYIRPFNPLERKNWYHAINIDDYHILRSRGIKVFYVPNGVNTQLFTPLNDKFKFDNFTVLFIGSRWQKGVDFMPEIISKTLKKDKGVHFILIGGMAPSSALRFQLEKLEKRYPANISFKRHPCDEELRELYSKSHLFLFPSRYEGFGNVVLEAQSSGLPVLAFNIPGAPRDIILNGITGSLVTPYDLDVMVKEIIKYHLLWENNREAYHKISLRARERAMEFDWNTIMTSLHSYFNEVLNQS
jgi:glycosyltransferase involved in cell wall biosynthesis